MTLLNILVLKSEVRVGDGAGGGDCLGGETGGWKCREGGEGDLRIGSEVISAKIEEAVGSDKGGMAGESAGEDERRDEYGCGEGWGTSL